MSACLTCGGQLALYPSGHWKHSSVPDGWQDSPHQARRAETDRETIEARGKAMLDAAAEWNRTHERPASDTVTLSRPDVAVAAPHPAPIEAARDVMDTDVIPRTLQAVLDLLAGHGWHRRRLQRGVGYKMGSLALIENLLLDATRQATRERVVVWWEDSGYGGGYHLSPFATEPINYTQLRKIITSPAMLCDTCGLPPLAHPIPRESPACFQEAP